jgi:hypothetical protein
MANFQETQQIQKNLKIEIFGKMSPKSPKNQGSGAWKIGSDTPKKRFANKLAQFPKSVQQFMYGQRGQEKDRDKMKTGINPSELEIIKEFEGYTLARYNGDLGIWKIYSENIDWPATLALPQEAGMVYLESPIWLADQFDDDCNHLLDPQFDGVFECRVLDIKAEINYLVKQGI